MNAHEHEPATAAVTTEGIEVELTEHGLFIETQRPTGRWDCMFIPAPRLRLMVARDLADPTWLIRAVCLL